jgi:glycine/D-amino acid oxidase-like deaminating enzyme
MAMAEFDFDAVVAGAGAVGLACGYALARRGLVVAVLEQESAIGQGVSSRNSEVIHGGLYYPTGSLKARLCVAGLRALYAFLEAHHVTSTAAASWWWPPRPTRSAASTRSWSRRTPTAWKAWPGFPGPRPWRWSPSCNARAR